MAPSFSRPELADLESFQIYDMPDWVAQSDSDCEDVFYDAASSAGGCSSGFNTARGWGTASEASFYSARPAGSSLGLGSMAPSTFGTPLRPTEAPEPSTRSPSIDEQDVDVEQCVADVEVEEEGTCDEQMGRSAPALPEEEQPLAKRVRSRDTLALEVPMLVLKSPAYTPSGNNRRRTPMRTPGSANAAASLSETASVPFGLPFDAQERVVLHLSANEDDSVSVQLIVMPGMFMFGCTASSTAVADVPLADTETATEATVMEAPAPEEPSAPVAELEVQAGPEQAAASAEATAAPAEEEPANAAAVPEAAAEELELPAPAEEAVAEVFTAERAARITDDIVEAQDTDAASAPALPLGAAETKLEAATPTAAGSPATSTERDQDAQKDAAVKKPKDKSKADKGSSSKDSSTETLKTFKSFIKARWWRTGSTGVRGKGKGTAVEEAPMTLNPADLLEQPVPETPVVLDMGEVHVNVVLAQDLAFLPEATSSPAVPSESDNATPASGCLDAETSHDIEVPHLNLEAALRMQTADAPSSSSAVPLPPPSAGSIDALLHAAVYKATVGEGSDAPSPSMSSTPEEVPSPQPAAQAEPVPGAVAAEESAGELGGPLVPQLSLEAVMNAAATVRAPTSSTGGAPVPALHECDSPELSHRGTARSARGPAPEQVLVEASTAEAVVAAPAEAAPAQPEEAEEEVVAPAEAVQEEVPVAEEAAEDAEAAPAEEEQGRPSDSGVAFISPERAAKQAYKTLARLVNKMVPFHAPYASASVSASASGTEGGQQLAAAIAAVREDGGDDATAAAASPAMEPVNEAEGWQEEEAQDGEWREGQPLPWEEDAEEEVAPSAAEAVPAAEVEVTAAPAEAEAVATVVAVAEAAPEPATAASAHVDDEGAVIDALIDAVVEATAAEAEVVAVATAGESAGVAAALVSTEAEPAAVVSIPAGAASSSAAAAVVEVEEPAVASPRPAAAVEAVAEAAATSEIQAATEEADAAAPPSPREIPLPPVLAGAQDVRAFEVTHPTEAQLIAQLQPGEILTIITPEMLAAMLGSASKKRKADREVFPEDEGRWAPDAPAVKLSQGGASTSALLTESNSTYNLPDSASAAASAGGAEPSTSAGGAVSASTSAGGASIALTVPSQSASAGGAASTSTSAGGAASASTSAGGASTLTAGTSASAGGASSTSAGGASAVTTSTSTSAGGSAIVVAEIIPAGLAFSPKTKAIGLDVIAASPRGPADLPEPIKPSPQEAEQGLSTEEQVVQHKVAEVSEPMAAAPASAAAAAKQASLQATTAAPAAAALHKQQKSTKGIGSLFSCFAPRVHM